MRSVSHSLLLFTNILQSHGLVMTRALELPLLSAVAGIQGVSFFHKSMLTQVRAADFQLEEKTKQHRPSVVGYFWRIGLEGRNLLFYSSTVLELR